MSWTEFDAACARARMKDYLKPEDLNTEGCISLAEEVLTGASEDYIRARRAVLLHPHDKDARDHLKVCELFYRSDWFAALSGGVVDGETAMRKLNKIAARGIKVCATAT